ncbi:PLDc N-terminal domain-containing protein [Leucobacter rhizosphaerae]|uniref:PLDc N-terminal domain-containing protein n=1 Tax=Leucobacter rhizosphaerae TaxID=2932245 RepID=A0ABY4FU40_9MICO|nr:PLDc N-terminal domain-containing protein [Leucobacter rhizosphaerae]UOQ59800.1 PLDc N-terminal domain-containing protein [Leucobacter rhizosphaerae]
MVRFLIIGIVIAVAFTLYALVDAAMTDGSRARGVSKPVWVVVIVLLPVIGGILWFLIGKGATPAKRPQAPDDDPRFTGTRMSPVDLDVHMRDLEDRLRELDDEVFPGEPDEPRGSAQPGASGGSAASDADGRSGSGSGSGSGTGSSSASSTGPGAPESTSSGATDRPEPKRQSGADESASDAETTADGDSGATQK